MRKLSLPRKENWRSTLERELQTQMAIPHHYGGIEGHDCLTLVANLVLSFTGEDIAKQLRGRYKTKRGSIRILKRYGGDIIVDGLWEKLSKEYGFEEIDPKFAKVGDVAILYSEEGNTLGMYVSGGRYIASSYPRKPSVIFSKREDVIRAWRI